MRITVQVSKVTMPALAGAYLVNFNEPRVNTATQTLKTDQAEPLQWFAIDGYCPVAGLKHG
jgi:hypothetical protein